MWKCLELVLTTDLNLGACTMIVNEQIQSYRISFELTKPNHSNLALLVKWSWSSTFSTHALILSQLSPCTRMCDISGEQPITTQSKCDSLLARKPARFKTLLLKVTRLKKMRNLNAFPLKCLSVKRGQIKEIILLYQCRHKWNLWSYFI